MVAFSNFRSVFFLLIFSFSFFLRKYGTTLRGHSTTALTEGDEHKSIAESLEIWRNTLAGQEPVLAGDDHKSIAESYKSWSQGLHDHLPQKELRHAHMRKGVLLNSHILCVFGASFYLAWDSLILAD